MFDVALGLSHLGGTKTTSVRKRNTPAEGIGPMRSWRQLGLTLLVALAALGAPRLLEAQTGSVTGVVTDKDTKQPIEGATVLLQGTQLGAVTLANGRYTILGVPPGTYTVTARRIGYGTIEVTNVQVRIDVRRDQNFELSASQTLSTVTIVAPPVPLVEKGTVGSTTTITSEQIQALPVTSINEVLALQQGFQETPANTNLLSLSEERRSTVAPVRVRGSRGGSTVSLVDGIPVINPLFGSSAINLNALAVAQVDFTRGYMEPQYGNGLAGVINNAVREGGERFQGSIDYQTSALPGLLGSVPDELQGSHLFRGYISGPIPGTANKLRYALSGQVQSQKTNVQLFDNDVSRFNAPQTDEVPRAGAPQTLDLEQGWRAFGGTNNLQVVGKLTWLATPTTKLSVSFIDEARSNQSYDRRYLLNYGGDPWSRVNNLMDSLGVRTSRNFANVLQASVRSEAQLLAASWVQQIGRSNFSVRVGQQEFLRNTCSIWQGVCIGNRYWEGNFTESFKTPFGSPASSGFPYGGTDLFYGGEQYTVTSIRSDFQSQVTDHHNLQAGVSYTLNDIVYREARGIDGNSGQAAVVNQVYRAKPIEVSTYLQDRIEYDFLTIRLGLRYDYGLAKGQGFTDPLNSTNNTTAREVCNGTAPGINSTPFTFEGQTGVLACLQSTPNAENKPFLLDSATKLAQVDDFTEAKARTAFQPRIGLSFPLTETSQMFFNAGRYVKNPSYHDVYRNSGVGTVAGDQDQFCAATAIKPGTTECHPPLIFNNPDFIGNPNLLLEQSTSYELGYGAEIGNYGINVSVYNRDEAGLTGIRVNEAIQDIGSTYNGISLPQYRITVNQDFLTARGIEVQFRKRLVNRWSYDLNYGWMRVTENSPPPDRAFEAVEAGEVATGTTFRELTSAADRGHTFNASLTYAFGRNDIPNFRGASALRNTRFSLTYSLAQGGVYTPIRNFAISGVVNQLTASEQNTGRGPSTQMANIQIQKDLQVGPMRYGAFIRISNAFNIVNCQQVFPNTGNCNSGVREFSQRREGNGIGTSSTALDQPEFRSQTRRYFTGLTITF
jgi:uncharacterized membrane protein